MKRISRILQATLFLCLACNPASDQAATGDEASLRAVIAAYDSAWMAKDSARVARYLAEDYIYFTSTGGVSSLSESFGFLQDTTYRLTRSDRSEFGITVTGPMARVSSRWVGEGAYRGTPIRDDQTCVQIWTWRDARWQLFSEHCANRSQPVSDSLQ
jgi:ketosteroid isomerase-like protein